MSDCTILSDASPVSKQSEIIKIKLKQHQCSLINYCRTLEESSKKKICIPNKVSFKTKIGIIGDVVGSGKTLSILAIIAENPELKNFLPHTYNNQHMTFCEEIDVSVRWSPYNIIVVPHTIFLQWSDTIKKYTSLNFYGINNKKSLEKFEDIFSDDISSNEYQEFSKNKIILISSSKYNQFCNIGVRHWNTYRMTFSRVIFDEADSIKIPACHDINASFVWFVTSSYHTLLCPYGTVKYSNNQGVVRDDYSYTDGFINRIVTHGINNTGFIKTTMVDLTRQAASKFIKYIFVKNSEDFVKKSFTLPDYIMNVIECKMPYYLTVLNNNISQDIINHINAGDIKGAIEKFGCETAENEHELIKEITKDLQQKLDNKKIELDMKLRMTYSNKKAKEEAILRVELGIKHYTDKINSIKEKLDETSRCVICYSDEVENPTVSPCCNTKYCCKCISKWIATNPNCPFCRNQLSYSSLIVVCDKKKEVKIDNLLSKIDNLKKIIESRIKDPNFKMLIFSDFSNSFNGIVSLLSDFNLKYSEIMGHSSSVNKTLKRFKENVDDKIDVLLLNSKFCASGINLENSTDIVIYHSMCDDKTTQVIGRGQRPGRTQPLNVWKLCYKNEM